MKPKKLFLILAPILVLVVTSPVSGYYDPVDIIIHLNEPGEDHPWGGDITPTGDELMNKQNNFNFPGTQLFFIDILRLLSIPDFRYESNTDSNNAASNGLLPDTFGNGNDINRGNPGKDY